MYLPNNFKELAYLLDKHINFKNILIVNTPTTGHFLNNFFLEERTLRISYVPNKYNKFVEIVNNLNQKFDLICVDPYHEYKESIETFTLLTKLLNENGVLISHDCYPPNFNSSYPTYKKGEWCGVTYAAFIEIAHDNPNWYYAIINNDYGLGIISKEKIQYVEKITNSEKQKIFLNIFKEKKYKEAYNYFINNSTDIINLLNC